MGSNTRAEAHSAMRELWGQVDAVLQRDAVAPEGTDGIRRVETERGATITDFAGLVTVRAEFDKPDGTTEITEITFPVDIRDMSETGAETTWLSGDGQRSGVNTVPLRDFPKIAKEFGGLLI